MFEHLPLVDVRGAALVVIADAYKICVQAPDVLPGETRPWFVRAFRADDRPLDTIHGTLDRAIVVPPMGNVDARPAATMPAPTQTTTTRAAVVPAVTYSSSLRIWCTRWWLMPASGAIARPLMPASAAARIASFHAPSALARNAVARVSATISAVDRFAIGVDRRLGDDVAVRCDDVPVALAVGERAVHARAGLRCGRIAGVLLPAVEAEDCELRLEAAEGGGLRRSEGARCWGSAHV